MEDEKPEGFNNAEPITRRIGQYHNGTIRPYMEGYSWSLNRRNVSLERGIERTEGEAWAAIMFHVKQLEQGRL